MDIESVISVVCVADDEMLKHRSALADIQAVLEREFADYEILIVRQGPYTAASDPADSLLADLPCIRILQLSARCDLDIALGAGLENAIGDFLVIMDLETDPPGIIPELVNICRSGSDVVVGTSRHRNSPLYSVGRLIGGLLLKAVEYSLPKNATSLRCLSRRAVNAATRTGRFHHRLALQIQKTGYPSSEYKYEPLKPFPSRGLFGGLKSIAQLMVFNSFRPLRFVSGLGLAGSVIAMLFSLYSLLVHLVKRDVIQGWTTTILFMSTFSSMQFIMLAFLGEYIGRLLEERGEHADYSIVLERHSSRLVNKDRYNVKQDPVETHPNSVQTARNN